MAGPGLPLIVNFMSFSMSSLIRKYVLYSLSCTVIELLTFIYVYKMDYNNMKVVELKPSRKSVGYEVILG